MTTPVEVEVHDDTKNILDALAHGDPDLLAAGLELRADWKAWPRSSHWTPRRPPTSGRSPTR